MANGFNTAKGHTTHKSLDLVKWVDSAETSNPLHGYCPFRKPAQSIGNAVPPVQFRARELQAYMSR